MWIVEKIKVNEKNKLIILLTLAILPYPYLPFQLYRVAYYLLFFFAGYKVWQYGDSYRKNINDKKVIAFWIIFIVIFIGLRILSAHLIEEAEATPIQTKFVLKVAATSCKIVYSSFGVVAMYSTAIWFTNNYKIHKSYINIGSLCFGVYVYQEFILKYLYYYTNLPNEVGCFALPWIAFCITLVLSLLLSKTTKSL